MRCQRPAPFLQWGCDITVALRRILLVGATLGCHKSNWWNGHNLHDPVIKNGMVITDRTFWHRCEWKIHPGHDQATWKMQTVTRTQHSLKMWLVRSTEKKDLTRPKPVTGHTSRKIERVFNTNPLQTSPKGLFAHNLDCRKVHSSISA